MRIYWGTCGTLMCPQIIIEYVDLWALYSVTEKYTHSHGLYIYTVGHNTTVIYRNKNSDAPNVKSSMVALERTYEHKNNITFTGTVW